MQILQKENIIFLKFYLISARTGLKTFLLML